MLDESEYYYTQNTTENEFHIDLSFLENPASLEKHLDFLSKKSKQGYLRILLEN